MDTPAVTYPLPPWPAPLPSTPMLAQTRWGLLWLDPSDIVGRTLLGVQGDRDVRAGISPARADGHFWDGDLLLPLYEECAAPDSYVIIVGANFGQDALACAQLGAGVLAVEANPRLAQRLIDTMARNDHGRRVAVLPYVATDQPGYYRLAAPLADVSSQAYVAAEVVVQGALAGGPLDGFVRQDLLAGRRVSLVQVDAQGQDLRVLQGLRQTIRQHQPVICFEYEATEAAAIGDTWAQYHAWMHDGCPVVYDWVESGTHRNNWIGRPRA
jgi:FkbM family methyltransferase